MLKLSLYSFSIINLLLIIFSILGFIILDKKLDVKLLSKNGVITTFLFLTYLILAVFIGIQAFINKSCYGPVYLGFAFFPFIIGKMVEYDELTFYTIMQILLFIASLILTITLITLL